MGEQASGFVSTDIDNAIGTITFFHPAGNSLPGEILAALAEAIEQAGQHPGIKVIILRSAGERAFCGGASFDELKAIEDAETGKKFFSGFAHVINAARKCPKFILGRVQGKAVGGGVGMASAVDYCFALKAASVKLSELAVGIGPFVVGPAVARKMGLSAMSTMTINATKWFDATWAQEKGLFAEVFETAEEMDAAIMELATQLSASNPEAVKMLKKVFWEGFEHWDSLLSERAAMSGALVLSEFTKEFLRKFK
jgi:methylglutaconyl-CoA hydratase